jgi:predicted DNA-binding transcriptional regulator YafY
VDDSGAVITIKVYPNIELEQLILSFGENVEVLEPLALRERIKQRLSGAMMNYEENVQKD